MKWLLTLFVLLLAGCSTEPDKPGMEACLICGNEISVKADTCPSCGEPYPTKTRRDRIESDRKRRVADAKVEAAELNLLVEQERAKPFLATISAMEDLQDRLSRYTSQNGKLPDEETAKSIAWSIKDGWGFGLHFDFTDEPAGKYVTRSTGDDTIIREFSIARVNSKPEKAGPGAD